MGRRRKEVLSSKTLARVRTGIQTNNQTGFKGVHFENWSGKYRATIGYKGRIIRLGRYNDPAVAAYVYNAKAKELYGKDAFQNTGL